MKDLVHNIVEALVDHPDQIEIDEVKGDLTSVIPLLVDKDDEEVQWHAKNGLVLTAAEFALWLVFNLLAATGIGCVFVIFLPIIFVVFAVIRVVAIVKGLKGERFVIPGLSQYVDKF